MTEPLEKFRARALAWLEANARRSGTLGDLHWGEGPDSVALFQNLAHETEKALIDRGRAWIQCKADAGFANISWPTRWGGQGLPASHERAFTALEQGFEVPPRHESLAITVNLVAPTILAFGTEEQRERHLRTMVRAEEMWCQLMSEPGAGSDLASVATRAERGRGEWIINGQKVWTSGAQFADWGYILCRTDPAVPKHQGLTTFVLPMSTPGVDVRPLRQATGGSSFNEVYLDGVRVPDANRLGDPGAGWRVAVATLGFERGAMTGDHANTAVVTNRLLALAHRLGENDAPVARQLLIRAWARDRINSLTAARVQARRDGGDAPGPEGSLGKLAWTEALQRLNDAASLLLGARLAANTGEWGTYTWSEHVVGTTGYRIAGGSDEIQRNIIGERSLGLPSEPRTDREIPFHDIRR